MHTMDDTLSSLTAYNVPDLEKKPTATVSRPLRGHLSRVKKTIMVACYLMLL